MVGQGAKCWHRSEYISKWVSPEWCISFLNALGGNSYVERLDLSHIKAGDGTAEALAAGLRGNEGLTHLGLSDGSLDERCWGELMAAISAHPSLHTLAFEHIDEDEDEDEDPDEDRLPSPSVIRDRTEAVADMLLTNQQVDQIPFDDHTFDRFLWNTRVVPKLECNLFRKRFVPLQKIGEPSTRDAVVARALARVARKLYLVWMPLSQNVDVLSSYLVEPLPRDDSVSVTASRKRSYSSFSDGSSDFRPSCRHRSHCLSNKKKLRACRASSPDSIPENETLVQMAVT
jgi:hypothetical protein